MPKPLKTLAPRIFLALSLLSGAGFAGAEDAVAEVDAPRTFNVWAASCAHVGVDSPYGIEPMRHAFRQSEGYWSFLTRAEQRMAGVAPTFEWDIMINVGDFATGQFPPSDGEGRAVVDQYDALEKHTREQIYTVSGNHDAGYYDQGLGAWFQKWSDLLGENTATSGVDASRRPFPVEGTWERYKFEAGNVVFLMLSDRNDAPVPIGRGHSSERNMGGFLAGAVTRETFNWWKKEVLANQDKIIVMIVVQPLGLTIPDRDITPERLRISPTHLFDFRARSDRLRAEDLRRRHCT